MLNHLHVLKSIFPERNGNIEMDHQKSLNVISFITKKLTENFHSALITFLVVPKANR